MLEERKCKGFNKFWRSPHDEHEWKDWEGNVPSDQPLPEYWCPGRPVLTEDPNPKTFNGQNVFHKNLDEEK